MASYIHPYIIRGFVDAIAALYGLYIISPYITILKMLFQMLFNTSI